MAAMFSKSTTAQASGISEKGSHWKSWKAKTRVRSGIITIGWDIGKLEGLELEETKAKI